MPQQCQLARSHAIAILKKYIRFFEKPNIPKYSAEIWKDLAAETMGVWSQLSWWVNVKNNRRQILSEARKEMGITWNELEEGTGEVWLNLILSRNMWDHIKPIETHSTKGHKKVRSLQPKVWTNVIADEFYRQHELPCAFSFCRSQTSVSERKHYLKIEGYCRAKSCGNKFNGYIDKEPSVNDETITIRVRTQNISRKVHEDVRRYLNGEKRKQMGKESHAEGCSNVLKKMKRETMKRGDIEAPTLPTADVLRHAKHEHVNRELGIKKSNHDDIERIFQLQFERCYMGSIHGVGYNPFYVFYGLPEQLNLFQQFCRVMQDWSYISIDGTGSLVRKLIRPLGLKSGHIFLHCIVIHFAKELVSVFQMLSESQETETFVLWLTTFLNLVQRKPKQCVTDYARALLTSCSKTFNNMKIKDYINLVFTVVLTGNVSLLKHISTFIRVDVPHLIRMLCRWPATKEIKRIPVRDFCIRCVALMIDCQYLQQFQEIFCLTYVVLFHQYEDTVLNLNGVVTVKDARKKLENYMNKRPTKVDDYMNATNAYEENVMSVFDNDDEMAGTSNVEIYITQLIHLSKSIVHEGTEENAFQALAFLEQLVRIAPEFILWTAVGIPFFVNYASSSCSEKNFQDLKDKTLAKYGKKIGIEKFQRIHMNDLILATRSVASKLTQFVINGEKAPELKYKNLAKPQTDNISDSLKDVLNDSYDSAGVEISNSASNDSDLLSKENWKGKTTRGIFEQHGLDDEAKNEERDVMTDVEEAYVELEVEDYGTDGNLKWLCNICQNVYNLESVFSHNCSGILNCHQ